MQGKFDLHLAIIGLENQFFVFFEWRLKTGFTVYHKYQNLVCWPLHPHHFTLKFEQDQPASAGLV